MTINYHIEKLNIGKLSCTLSQKWKPHESVAKFWIHDCVLHDRQVIQAGSHQFPYKPFYPPQIYGIFLSNNTGQND